LNYEYVTRGAFKPTGYTACLFALTAVKQTASTSVASAFADNASAACAHAKGKGAPNTNTYTFSHINQASMVAESATNQHLSLRRLHITLFFMFIIYELPVLKSLLTECGQKVCTNLFMNVSYDCIMYFNNKIEKKREKKVY
jgi:hypothetical protein